VRCRPDLRHLTPKFFRLDLGAQSFFTSSSQKTEKSLDFRHIQAMRKAAPMTDEERAKFNTPKVPGVPQPRPPPGPNGTYGEPDLTGLRWKTLRAGEGTMPYPRVPAR